MEQLKILTLGCFDIPHYGHYRLLKRCSQMGDVTVGVNTDRFVQTYKNKPVMTYDERATTLQEWGLNVVPNDSPGKELIEKVNPDILVVGSDWSIPAYKKQIDVTQEWLDNHDVSVCYVPYTKSISSSEIKARVHNSNSPQN